MQFHRTSFAEFVFSTWRSLASLIWPVQCAGCGTWDVTICDSCSALARQEPFETLLDDAEGVPGWPLFALGSYSGRLRSVILSAKHEPVRNLDAFLSESGRSLGRTLGKQPWTGRVRTIWVVPAPSSRARVRAKAEIVPRIAEGVVKGIEETYSSVHLVQAVSLIPKPGIRIQGLKSLRGSGARARGLARSGKMRLTRVIPDGVAIVVVDDVCASGATIREVLRHTENRAVALAVVAVSGNTASRSSFHPERTEKAAEFK